jgi:hypothetical protein
MLEFLSVLFNTFQQANVHTAIFINGALEPDRSGALSFALVSKKCTGSGHLTVRSVADPGSGAFLTLGSAMNIAD